MHRGAEAPVGERERYQALRRLALHPIDILFWACLMLGGAYTLLNLLMGGLTHAAGHAGHAGHIGHIGHDLHLPHGHIGHAGAHAAHGAASHGGHAHAPHAEGHAHAHGQHGQQGAADLEEPGPRIDILAWLNPMAVAGFLLGFGGVGVMARGLGAHPLAASLFGTAGGYGLWLLAYLVITRFFGAAEGTSHYTRQDVIGLRGQVTAPIDGARPGMVACTVAGARQTVRAISDDEEPIPTGATVRIRKIENNTAHVMRIE